MTLIVGQERNEEGQGVGAATSFQLSRLFLVSSGQMPMASMKTS